MEAAAEQRRLKIDALRRLRRAEAMGDKDAAGDEVGLAVKRSFRSYDPVTGQAKQLASYDDLPDTVEKGTYALTRRCRCAGDRDCAGYCAAERAARALRLTRT